MHFGLGELVAVAIETGVLIGTVLAAAGTAIATPSASWSYWDF
jgi:hypothetical protein